MIQFLIEHYPTKGKMWCVKEMGLKENQVRSKASKLGLRQDRSSEFFKDWQSRAAESKVGKERPGQAEVMRRAIVDKGLHVPGEEARKAMSIRTKQWISVYGHPKGMQGLVHSEESRALMSSSGKKRWANMSEEEKDAHSKRSSLSGQKAAKNRESASWKSGWREIGGVRKYFRSRWEANYARYLELLKTRSLLVSWEHEPETFWFDGIKRGCMSYLPDFRIIQADGDVAYHEVKGWMDDRSKTKIKRMAKYFPDVKLVVIDSVAYKALEKSFSGLVDGWEL